MSRQPRHQTVISRQSDESHSEDHWLKEFENKLQKTSVQPRGSLYEQITSIMNTKSKYPSVQAAVDDMMHRSGLTTYLSGVKESQEKVSEQKPSKTAQTMAESKADDEEEDERIPEALRKIPGLRRTLENIMRETKGNLPISAIVGRLKALYSKDTPNEAIWDDDDLLRCVSRYNLEAKKSNPSTFDKFDNLGRGDHSTDQDIDASNTDAFNVLMPAKI